MDYSHQDIKGTWNNQSSLLQETSSGEERLRAEEGRHRFVHDAVALHEAQRGFGQRLRVGRASPWARRRFLDPGHRQPVRVGRLLNYMLGVTFEFRVIDAGSF